MLNDLQIYYLQTMGIDVWLPRQKKSATQKTKLLIIGARSSQSQILFNNMMQSIALLENDFEYMEASESEASLAEKITTIQPGCLLVFSTDIAQSLLQKPVHVDNQLHHYHTIPLIVSYHPDYLLQHPQEKKQAWRNLLRLQALLQTS